MYKIIILTIAMLTLSACDSLGLSTAEPAEPVDLSSIEAKLDTIESKSEPPSEEYTEAIKAITKAIQEHTKAVQENTKALEASKPAPNKAVSEKDTAKKEDSKPQSTNDISSDSDETYGKTANNPVKVGKPLQVDMMSDLLEMMDNMDNPEYATKIYLEGPDAEIIFGKSGENNPLLINRTNFATTMCEMTPITFHDAQTNKPITLFKNDETSRPLIFSPSKNSGLQKICLNQLKEPYNNTLIFDLVDQSQISGMLPVQFKYKYILVD